MYPLPKLLFLVSSLFVFLSCATSTLSENDKTTNTKTDLKHYQLPDTLVENLKFDSVFDEHLLENLKTAYNKHHYYTFWFANDTLNTEAKELISILKSAAHYGLSTNLYITPQLDSLLLLKEHQKSTLELTELLLTKAYITFAKHIDVGILPTHFKELNYNPTFEDTLQKNYAQLLQANKIESLWFNIERNHQYPEYQALQKSLANYCQNTEISEEKIAVSVSKNDSTKAFNQARKALILHQYLSENDAIEKTYEALLQFQKDHDLTPDGKIGKYTAQELSKSTYDVWLQAALNLQKWRWETNWTQYVLYANIPSFSLKIYEDFEMQQMHKTVVGTPYTATPTLTSKLEHFILNPEWYVPTSITHGELIPKMQKDPTYLERNGYALVSKTGVSIADIDWNAATNSNFKHTIKQNKGSGNALGVVKFIFKNKHSVYFHDTPSKSFFEKDIRAFSHGCVRIQNPLNLAAYLLKEEGASIPIDSLKTIVALKNQKTYKLSNEYTVLIRYFTSSGDENQKLHTHIDIYQKDIELLKEMHHYLTFHQL